MPGKSPKGTTFKVNYEDKPTEKIKLKAFALELKQNTASKGDTFSEAS